MTRISKGNTLLIIVILLSQFIPPFIPVSKNTSMALNQYIFFVIPVLIFIGINKMNLKSTLRLNKLKFKDIILISLLTISIMPITGLISNVSASIFGSPITAILEDFYKNNSFSFIFFCVAITPAICEEIVLRGALLSCYENRGPMVAIIMNGFLFGMFHLNLHQFCYTAFLGMIIAYVVWYTRSIFAGMLMHLINNGFSVILSRVLSNPEVAEAVEKSSNTATTSDFQSIVILGITIIFAAVISIILMKAIKNNNSYKFDNYTGQESSIPVNTNSNLTFNNEPYDQEVSTPRDIPSDVPSGSTVYSKKESLFNIPIVILIAIFISISISIQLYLKTQG